MRGEPVFKATKRTEILDANGSYQVDAAPDVPRPACQRAKTERGNVVLELVNDVLFDLQREEGGEG